MSKTEKIPSVSDDPAVITAQKKLAELEQKLERAINRPSQAIEDDIRERAELLLTGKPPKPKEAPGEIKVLKTAVSLALTNYQEVRQAAAAKIIRDCELDYKKVRAELLTECLRFKEALTAHDDYIQALWSAGLYDYLPASWSKKAPVVQIYPSGRLDMLIQNLQIDLK
jgi:hypothetical protein